MKIAMLSPIAWRTPPEHYGPWERVTSLLSEELVRHGIAVTLFATQDSVTAANLQAVCPHGYEEDPTIDPKYGSVCIYRTVLNKHTRLTLFIINSTFYLCLIVAWSLRR